jgi:hypothetical protein
MLKFLVGAVVKYYLFFLLLIFMIFLSHTGLNVLLPNWCFLIIGFAAGYMLLTSLLECIHPVFRLLGAAYALGSITSCLSVIHGWNLAFCTGFVFLIIAGMFSCIFYFYSYELSKLLSKRLGS